MKYAMLVLATVLSFVVFVNPGNYPCGGGEYRLQVGPKKGQYVCIIRRTGWISPGY